MDLTLVNRRSGGPAVTAGSADGTASAPEGRPAVEAVRGRYLSRHRARVIEQNDNVVVVEFVEHPWYTAAARDEPRRRGRVRRRGGAAAAVGATAAAVVLLPVWEVALLWGVSLSALTIGLLHWM
jgi:hypothetical protein